MDQLQLMRSRVSTLFTRDARGRLRHVNEPNGAVAPRFFLGRTSTGQVWQFREDVNEGLSAALVALCRQEPIHSSVTPYPANIDQYIQLLAQAVPIQRQWAGPAYRFPTTLAETPNAIQITPQNAALLETSFSDWLPDVAVRQPFLAVVIEGRVVSVCASVRIGPEVHEAGVETEVNSRGHGYAAQAVVAWAAAVRLAGAHPVYSTSWDNRASQTVAQRLRLIQFGVDFDLT